MFSSKKQPTRMTCGFKVNTNSPGWHKSMTKILKKIKGGNFTIDAEEGVAYVTGQGYPKKLLKLMGSETGKDAEMAFVKSGGHQYDPNLYNMGSYNYNNYGSYGQGMPYSGYWQPDLGYPYAPPPPPMFYPSAPPVPYHHQYPYSSHCTYGYY